MAVRKRNKAQNVNTVTEEKKDKKDGEYKFNKQEYESAQCQIYTTLGGAFLFSCLCTTLIWYFLLREKEIIIEYSVINPIRVLSLSSPRDSFVADALKGQEPLVIKKSFVDLWPARKLWSPKYLQSKFKKLDGIYENSNRWFGPYYDTRKPLTPYTTHPNPYKTNLTLTSNEFFKRIQNPIPNRYHYLTSDIDNLGNWEAINDLYPLDEMLSPNPSRSSINVWIGQPNVIAHCHYDGYHNFYTQLYGKKKFTLLRPSQWPGLYPYPFLHPSHAQAQVNLSRLTDAKEFHLSAKLEVYEVILEPGDVLYMPPLWFHHVESMSTSISVNVWTDSQQTTIMESVYELNIPFTQVNWHGGHLKAIGGSMVIYKAVENVCKLVKCPLSDQFNINETNFNSGGQYFMYRLWNGRYSKLVEKSVLHSKFIPKKNTGTRKSLLCENDALPSLFFQGISQKLYEAPVDQYIKKLSHLIKKLPSDTWEIWFGNYIEYLVSQAVDLLDVGLFIKHYDSCSEYFQ